MPVHHLALCTLLILFSSIMDHSQAEVTARDFFGKTNTELFELSGRGTLGKVVAAKGPDESLQFIQAISPHEINTTFKMASSAKIPYRLNRFWVVIGPKHWYVTPEHVKLIQPMIKKLSPEQSLMDVLHFAEYESQRRRDNGTHDETIYYGFELTGPLRGQIFYVQIEPAQQRHIEALLQNPEPLRDKDLTPFERKLTTKGFLTLEEIAELRALREVTQVFSKYSSYRDQLGGWNNNSVFGLHMCEVQAFCGEHSYAMSQLLQSLKHMGYLKYFDVGPNVTREGIGNNHAGATLVSKRNQYPVVVDSWLVPGSTPARILPLSSWAYRRQNEDRSISANLCRIAFQ